MREELGNRQANWLNKVMPLACGRLVGGYRGRNWVAGKGWVHEAPAAGPASASVPCLYRPPAAGDGGPEPGQTLDPSAVEAAQRALADFYRFTNETYSRRGYPNPQLMREELGNDSGRWLDQALALARGELACGFRCMAWIPDKGWSNEAGPASSTAASRSPAGVRRRGGDAWSGELRSLVGDTGPLLAPQPGLLRSGAMFADPVVERIIASLGVLLEDDS
jgi:hypothetical protein